MPTAAAAIMVPAPPWWTTASQPDSSWDAHHGRDEWRRTLHRGVHDHVRPPRLGQPEQIAQGGPAVLGKADHSKAVDLLLRELLRPVLAEASEDLGRGGSVAHLDQ